MRTAIFAILWIVSGACGHASATPQETECPLVHPDDRALEFVGASLDQSTQGPPRQPEPEEEVLSAGNEFRYFTHYASYRFLRDAILICSYAEIRDRRIVNADRILELRFPMPGILMRCDGIVREATFDQPALWKRRWCVHEPGK